jgi:hypothetical protein
MFFCFFSSPCQETPQNAPKNFRANNARARPAATFVVKPRKPAPAQMCLGPRRTSVCRFFFGAQCHTQCACYLLAAVHCAATGTRRQATADTIYRYHSRQQLRFVLCSLLGASPFSDLIANCELQLELVGVPRQGACRLRRPAAGITAAQPLSPSSARGVVPSTARFAGPQYGLEPVC